MFKKIVLQFKKEKQIAVWCDLINYNLQIINWNFSKYMEVLGATTRWHQIQKTREVSQQVKRHLVTRSSRYNTYQPVVFARIRNKLFRTTWTKDYPRQDLNKLRYPFTTVTSAWTWHFVRLALIILRGKNVSSCYCVVVLPYVITFIKEYGIYRMLNDK